MRESRYTPRLIRATRRWATRCKRSLAKPVLLVVGRKEAAERTVSIRRLGRDRQQTMPLDAALAMLADEATPPDIKRGG